MITIIYKAEKQPALLEVIPTSTYDYQGSRRNNSSINYSMITKHEKLKYMIIHLSTAYLLGIPL